MIEKVWRESYLGANFLRESKLTEDHFNKNAHNRMRVHLAAQILSNTVLDMLDNNLNDDEKEKYESLYSTVRQLNTVIDIWNHPRSKRFKGSTDEDRYSNIKKEEGKEIKDHIYLKYLENVLKWFSDWRAETVRNKTYSTKFVLNTLYESFCWIVCGMKGVASQIPDGHEMVQRRGGTDDLENEFARQRQSNSNPTIMDSRGMMAQAAGFRATDFTKNIKNNTGDKRVYLKALIRKQTRKISNSRDAIDQNVK